jgi:hypothetical protein
LATVTPITADTTLSPLSTFPAWSAVARRISEIRMFSDGTGLPNGPGATLLSLGTPTAIGPQHQRTHDIASYKRDSAGRGAALSWCSV